MKIVLEEYGRTILEFVGAIAFMELLKWMTGPSGFLCEWIRQFGEAL